jgi:hypothetical protein
MAFTRCSRLHVARPSAGQVVLGMLAGLAGQHTQDNQSSLGVQQCSRCAFSAQSHVCLSDPHLVQTQATSLAV